jgi:hypothetical protein
MDFPQTVTPPHTPPRHHRKHRAGGEIMFGGHRVGRQFTHHNRCQYANACSFLHMDAGQQSLPPPPAYEAHTPTSPNPVVTNVPPPPSYAETMSTPSSPVAAAPKARTGSPVLSIEQLSTGARFRHDPYSPEGLVLVA